MQVIRAGVFETNSSSTHSISIAGKTDTLDTFPLDNDICKVHPGEFGWEEETHHSASMKASYCLTFLKSCSEERQEHLSQMLKEVLKNETGKVVEFVSASDEFYKWGYIDHQSDFVCAEAFESKENLRNFIFNPESWLRTDNDNH